MNGFNKFAAECDDINTKECAFFEQQVVEPMETWVGALEGCKTKVKELDAYHATFDHYEKKVAEMKKSREARFAKGKQDSVRCKSLFYLLMSFWVYLFGTFFVS
jgi:hypothetical protein